eukprot:g23578.t1
MITNIAIRGDSVIPLPRHHAQGRDILEERKTWAAAHANRFLRPKLSAEDEQRPGRRLYSRGRVSASESAPYGRSSDVSQHVPDTRSSAVPFGTDQDLRLRRPEDAGTDEYRAAVGGFRR